MGIFSGGRTWVFALTFHTCLAAILAAMEYHQEEARSQRLDKQP